MNYLKKPKLFELGCTLMVNFCRANPGITLPNTRLYTPADWSFDVCAYYRENQINICLERCATIGSGGASWSYPGYVIDRTPYGVIQHELGHHVDRLISEQKGSYFGNYSKDLMKKTGEAPITNYCPNDFEWFAEIFRLFVTNPDLLKQLRPRTFTELGSRFTPAVRHPWQQVLGNAPERTISQARKKIEVANYEPH